MLKPYSELTAEQKKLVEIMYSDHSNLEMYSYNFDGEKYTGRQYAPPSGKTKSGVPFGTIHAESVEANESGKVLLEKPEVKEVPQTVAEAKPTRARRTKK